ncbi:MULTISPECIES: hypothetical protein [Actinoplanes]|uniref:Uncharacterized protein n=2 Tax=Actinoplanes TaxID=1865 RepID=A0A117MQU0_9ACTN|nr:MULTISPECIES: hypothetical protein [Actinoplanes]KUL30729.1 hypothetical protein ADL15_24075 [Actinoplanes awajinensis subsp. mycoplanecinus]GIE69817.1 hypothetical protein Apa02nite_059250 [Actinoplanes palleronii]
MTAEYLLQTAETYERAFGFLTEEFDLRADRPQFRHGGFALTYQGVSTGVRVDWYPRDPISVWLLCPEAFDLQDFEELSGHTRQVGDAIYSPSPENALLLAENLRAYGADVLRGDLTRVPLVQARVQQRAAEFRVR